MQSAAERLKLAREKRFPDATDAAKALGLPPPTYLAHENGSRGFRQSADRYADFFNVNLEWLLTGRGQRERNVSLHENVRERFAKGHRQIVADRDTFVTVPEHDVRASAGPGTIVTDETEVAEWSLPRDYVRRTLSLRGNALAFIEVVGDSMEPTLHTGDKILVDLGDKNIAMPGVFALYDGDATVVKRVEKVPGTPEIQLISDNPLHSNYRVPADTVHIAGRVVWFGRRL